jgi:prophage regulatory protein
METRLLTPKAVCERTSLSRSSLDRLVAAGDFPKPIRITERRLAYSLASVEAWMQEKVAA